MSRRKKRKSQQYYMKVFATSLLSFLAVLGIARLIFYRSEVSNSERILQDSAALNASNIESAGIVSPTEPPTEEPTEPPRDYPKVTDDTQTLDSGYDAKRLVLFDIDNYEIIVGKEAFSMMYPASLTKVMTLVVAAENISDLNATVRITDEMLADLYEQDASVAGFIAGEDQTMEDVLYAMILASGADASIAAATYVAGSEEAFVELMNEKAEELGLKSTHFVNTSGLHDDNHYTTAADMAEILAYAYENPFCRQVLSTNVYQTGPTRMHPDGMYLESTLSRHMYGLEQDGIAVIGGKTGFTDEAGCCVESFADVNGKVYVQVYAGSESYMGAAQGTVDVYSQYCK